MSWFVAGKATALSKADLASKAVSGQPEPAEDAGALPDQATADTQQDEDDWEPAPTIKRKAALRRGTKDPPAKRDKGGRKRQAVESDSQDSAEEEEEQQPAGSRAHGLQSRQRRKQLVIEDESLEEDLGLGDGEPDGDPRHPGAEAEADATPAVPPGSDMLSRADVLSNAGMEGHKHLHTGSSSISHQAQTAPFDSSSNANQVTGRTDTLETAHVARPRGSHTDRGPSGFSLLDAMLQPDTSDSCTAPGRLGPSESRPHAEHLSADDHEAQTSIDAGHADRDASGPDQHQEALVSDAPPSSGPDVPPSRLRVQGSLRDRVKAFAALRK